VQRYVNADFAGRGSRLLGWVAPPLACRREAPGLVAAFRATTAARAPAPGDGGVEFDIPPYEGSNPHARRMMAGLAPLAPWLAGACVHGSIGSGEEIAYSDFDALVILRDSAFDSPATLASVGLQLGRLRRHMFDYDPLQHHGWFVLLERDLANYCHAWFPTALFPWCRSLLPGTGSRLRVRPRDSTAEYRAAFDRLADATLRQIGHGPPLGDAYRLKGLLSQFMLLPSLYLQARDGTAVFKRESFALAARDFSPTAWSAMERVSAVRAAWRCELSAARRLLLTRCVTHRRLVTRFVRVPVPGEVRERLTADLWNDAAALIRAMQARVTAGLPART
jgi:hypothetical protein